MTQARQCILLALGAVLVAAVPLVVCLRMMQLDQEGRARYRDMQRCWSHGGTWLSRSLDVGRCDDYGVWPPRDTLPLRGVDRAEP